MTNQSRSTVGWAQVIDAVQTPLGLLALIVLVSEVLLAVLAARAEGLHFTVLLCSMLIILFAVVAIVWHVVKHRPELLVSDPQSRQDTTPAPSIAVSTCFEQRDNVSSTVQEFGTDNSWIAFVEGAENTIEMLGYSMSETLANEILIRHISNFLKKPHATFRVLLASPTSPVISQRSIFLGTDPASHASKIYHAQEVLSELLGDKIISGKREIRTFSDTNIPYSLLRVDNKVLVIPYLCTKGKRDSLLIVLTADNGHLFKKVTEDFDRFWEYSQPLYNPRVSVPPRYVARSSEKKATSQQIAKHTARLAPETGGSLKCLDVGCGDGTQSHLLFNELKSLDTWKDVSVTFLDPSPFAVKACEAALIQQRRDFTSPKPVIQRMWQMYLPEDSYDLILCCHVLGAIFHQCSTLDYFRSEFRRMLSSLTPKGVLCVVLANERSIELELRRHQRKASRQILSAEHLEKVLGDWGIGNYEKHDVRSFLSLSNWLGLGAVEVSEQEKEMLNFLFAPPHEITLAVAEPYRKGLRQNARTFHELNEEDRQTYIKNIQRGDGQSPTDNDLFVETSHAVFLFRR